VVLARPGVDDPLEVIDGAVAAVAAVG
jgi:hypothetical protein